MIKYRLCRLRFHTTQIVITTVFFLLMTGFCFAQEEKLFEVKAKKFVYTPHIIKVNKGDVVRIRLISEDVHHGFFIDGYGIKTSAHPGQEGFLKFVADKTGRFSFRCSVTCGEFHPYMVGYLVVEPNLRYIGFIALTGIIGLANLLWLMCGRKRRNDTADKKDKLFGIIPLDYRFKLTGFKLVRFLLKSRWFPLLALILNLFIFVIILLSGLLGGYGAGNYNFGVMIVWILWWVML